MRLLLDTHALIWFATGDPQLPQASIDAIADPDNEVFVSATSAWEVATKFRKGKLPEAAVLESDFESIVVSLGMTELPVTLRHALLSGRLTLVNSDPWDRTLIAQAILENLVLVSIERSFESQGVRRLWD